MLAANLTSPPDPSAKLISVVAPAYNEEDVLPAFHKRLCAVFDGLDHELEVIYVNDGSSDRTIALLHEMRVQDPRITLIDLSRNFGKEIAMTAGLDHASGDAIVVIDTDLQDPPELIPEMIRLWLAGHDVVYAQRTAREGESWVKRATASAFYQVIQRLSRVKIPQDTGDFRLMSRRAVDALLRLREHHRFMKGLFAWVGFPQIAVPYRRDARFAGNTKWNYWKLWNFAIEGITSFTTVPLKIASYMGLFISLFAFAYAAFIIYKTLMFGDAVQGYPSLMVVVLMLGGIQLASLGIIGEYLGRMFNETKQRPLYLTQAVLPSRHAERRAAGASIPSSAQADCIQAQEA
ncbi:glycosyltransferase family 2 protein [Thiobacillus sp.]|uniref:glycosyltransferase family 2 protein n=1 Tax=Thiobacillus sp. TaxID=924 RepID=UPI0025F9F037|nr:glycosyltransferase family 2 protein [Thiobacillus sp.]MBT9538637.1 glycosyltransferase family 2 protein [Thiobacillus sp.]